MRASFIVGALVIAAAVIVALSFWPVDETAKQGAPLAPAEVVPGEVAAPFERVSPGVTGPVAPPPTEPTPDGRPAEPAIALPPLEASDAFVRAQLAGWHLPDAWLALEALVPRFTVVIANAADGRVPRSQLAFLSPGRPFEAERQGERLVIAQASYARFDSLIDLLLAIPPAELAALVDLLEPLIDEALRQLGRREGARTLVQRAVGRVRATPVPDGPVELVQPSVAYLYANPQLENLPEFEKQLLRMGPSNLRRLQNYAEAFAAEYATR